MEIEHIILAGFLGFCIGNIFQIWVRTGKFWKEVNKMELKEDKCDKCKHRWEMSKEHCNKCKHNPDNKPIERKGEADNFEAKE